MRRGGMRVGGRGGGVGASMMIKTDLAFGARSRGISVSEGGGGGGEVNMCVAGWVSGGRFLALFILVYVPFSTRSSPSVSTISLPSLILPGAKMRGP